MFQAAVSPETPNEAPSAAATPTLVWAVLRPTNAHDRHKKHEFMTQSSQKECAAGITTAE